MDKQKLEEFNVELSALLIKYGVSLQVNHGINVVPREVTSEVSGTEEVKVEELPTKE